MRCRIAVMEENARPDLPVKDRYRPRPDLAGSAEGDCPTNMKKAAREGIKMDKRFHGLEVIAMTLQDKGTINVIVRSAHKSNDYKIHGRVR